MSKKKSSVTQMLSSLLDQMQNRISDVANRGAANSDQIAELDTKINNVTKDSAHGFVEQKQAIADNAAGTTNALHSLKASTQRAIDDIATDIKSAHLCAQRHNARISSLEGDKGQTAIEVGCLRIGQASLEARISKLEKATEAAAPTAPTTSALEIDLKVLLKSYGYDVNFVSISKQEYDIVQTWAASTAKNQQIKIEIGGSKNL